MRKVVIIAASLFTLTAVHAQDAAKPDWWPDISWAGWLSGEVTAGYEAWRACVVAKAARFSNGPDPADLIVQAALVACKEERSRVVQILRKKNDDSEVKFSIDWITNQMEPVIKAEALLRVIELRVPK